MASEWRTLAACYASFNPVFFSTKWKDTSRQAKAICQGCPVRVECLDFAQGARLRYGVWGGLTEKERRRLRRRAA